MSKIPSVDKNGCKNIEIVPNNTTVETASETLCESDFSIEFVPKTAAAPQIDEPIAVNIHKSLSSLNTLVPK